VKREAMVDRLGSSEAWDVLVVGGGATGLGIAIDAAARGYRTLLVEQSDFAKGTSSRSTKLVHGGVRYLKQGNVGLVLEALKERGLMRQNAPHLVHDLPFVVPNYDWWEAPFYGVGLRLYDLLAGKHGFGHSENLSREETLARLPTIETRGLRGGVVYYDGQFDDARLAIDMAQTVADLGGTVLNYVRVAGLIHHEGFVRGARVEDVETGRGYEPRARVVVNATGAFSDALRRMDDPESPPIIAPSQGVHIVLDRSFLPGETAIMVPRTEDGRVLFAIPWHDRVVVGTTDTPIPEPSLEPRPLAEELDFLLEHAALYLEKDPTPADVLSAFAGVRPLVKGEGESTAALSRDHTVLISRAGLVTVAGGKWTTYRKMAEDAVDLAATVGQLEERPCPTRQLRIHGYHGDAEQFGALAVYGSDAPALQDLLRRDPAHREPLHPGLPGVAGEVIWAAEQEMARSVEDFLARRTRALLLDARASQEAAPRVAELLAAALGRDAEWQRAQVAAYRDLAAGYLMS
jgi:glycerol-3-phosphate dehydrogenase